MTSVAMVFSICRWTGAGPPEIDYWNAWKISAMGEFHEGISPSVSAGKIVPD
jgi:hypothetical protein